MKTYAITHAYADWCSDQQADLYFVLNHANSTFSKPLSYEVLSSQVRRLFYQLECEEWGYEQRETRWGRRYSRIERVVCIEESHVLPRQCDGQALRQPYRRSSFREDQAAVVKDSALRE